MAHLEVSHASSNFARHVNNFIPQERMARERYIPSLGFSPHAVFGPSGVIQETEIEHLYSADTGRRYRHFQNKQLINAVLSSAGSLSDTNDTDSFNAEYDFDSQDKFLARTRLIRKSLTTLATPSRTKYPNTSNYDPTTNLAKFNIDKRRKSSVDEKFFVRKNSNDRKGLRISLESLDSNMRPSLRTRRRSSVDLISLRKVNRSKSDTKLSLNNQKTPRLQKLLSLPNAAVDDDNTVVKQCPLLRFKRVAKTVVVLLKATSTRQEQIRSEEKQVSLATYQDEILNSRRSDYGNGLSFDPLEYRARKQVTLSNEAKTILSLNPKERTEEQIRVALLSLQNALDAFCEFPIKMQKSLVKRGWYEHFESKRVIIRQGHKADNFYMIICGKTVVTILKPDDKTGQPTSITAAILGKGKSFGELAIMHGATRSATVTCQTDVELLALHRDDFVDIFMHVEKNKEPEHISYLRGVDILKNWPIERLPWNDTRICLFMYFRRGTIMCKDSNQSDWIYVIKSGSCKVLKCLTATRPDVPGLIDTDYIDLASKNSSSLRPVVRPTTQTKSTHHLSGSLSTLSSSNSKLNSPSSHSKSAYSFLPPIKRTKHYNDDQLLENHKRKLDEIFKEIQYLKMRGGKKEEDKSRVYQGEKIFVELQKLGPKDTLGLEPIAFEMMDRYTSVSLVSEGVEAILISKKFFLQHLSEDFQRHLRTTLQPYPSEESLQQKLQDKTNWNAFKTITVNNFVQFNKYSHEALSF